jgi:putative MATE family efflux protein
MMAASYEGRYMIRQDKSTERLGNDKIGKLLFEFSVPAIIGMVVNAVYNTVDRIYVGQGVDPLGIAGISVSMPLMLAGTALAMLIGAGANALFSIRLGECRKDDVEKIMGNALTLLFIFSGLFVLLSFIFLDKIIVCVLGASETILPYAKTYLRIILFGGIFNAIGFGLNFFIRSDGHPRTSMFTQLIGAGINIILDPIFIFVCKWGIAGAAWATVTAQFISFLWVMLYFNSKSTQLRFRLANMKIDFSLALKIISVGFAPFARQLALGFVTGIMNHLLYQYGGDTAVAAMGIAYGVLLLIFMPLQGLTQGSQPIIGYNYGAKLYNRVRKTYKWACLSGTVFVSIAYAFIQLFPHIFIRLFTRDTGDILDMSIRCLRTSTLLLPIVGFQIISSNYFQSVGKPIQSIAASLSRQVLFYVPLVLILPKTWGLHGVFYAMPSADGLSAILALVFMVFELKRLRKMTE